MGSECISSWSLLIFLLYIDLPLVTPLAAAAYVIGVITLKSTCIVVVLKRLNGQAVNEFLTLNINS